MAQATNNQKIAGAITTGVLFGFAGGALGATMAFFFMPKNIGKIALSGLLIGSAIGATKGYKTTESK